MTFTYVPIPSTDGTFRVLSPIGSCPVCAGLPAAITCPACPGPIAVPEL